MDTGGRGVSLAAPDGAEAGPDTHIVILSQRRHHAAPEGIFQLPHIASGTEQFEITVPEGMQLSLVDLALEHSVPTAMAELVDPPGRGATGRQVVRVRWSHPVPLGRIDYRVTAYASPQGRPPPVLVPIGEPGVEHRLRRLVEQDAPVDLAVTGQLAQAFHDQILARGGRILPLASPMDGGVISGPTAVVIIGLAVIAAICIALGMAVIAAVIFFAISKGYNIDNAGYKVAVGEGNSRQEHQMVFNIRQPGT